MVIAWYRADEGYVPDYRTGMRLIFFADTSSNPWTLHVFGNNDWQRSASPDYWYYYRQGDEKYPTTTGLSVQYVSDVMIFSHEADNEMNQTPEPTPIQKTPLSPVTTMIALSIVGMIAGMGKQLR